MGEVPADTTRAMIPRATPSTPTTLVCSLTGHRMEELVAGKNVCGHLDTRWFEIVCASFSQAFQKACISLAIVANELVDRCNAVTTTGLDLLFAAVTATCLLK